MKVLVEKVNTGILFSTLTNGGRPSKRKGLSILQSLYNAKYMYFSELESLCSKYNFDNYYLKVRHRDLGVGDGSSPYLLRCEPSGFAFGNGIDSATMNDSRDASTNIKAKTLWIFQAPLNYEVRKYSSNLFYPNYSKVYEI